MSNEAAIPIPRIEQAIFLIRGQRVLLDRDLAALYGMETRALNKAVCRNLDRFPADFMFQLTREEADSSRFQFGTLKPTIQGIFDTRKRTELMRTSQIK
jgi:hypothetical protein